MPQSKSSFGEDTISSVELVPRCSVILEGTPPGAGQYMFLVLFNEFILIECKWQADLLETTLLPINIEQPEIQQLVASQPLICLLRASGGKGPKDPDPLLHGDNRAGGTVDLFPLVLGADKVCVTLPLVSINTGEDTGLSVEVTVNVVTEARLYKSTLLMTLVSAHCLPPARDGTVYLGAVALDEVLQTAAVNFGKSLSSRSATKSVWATVSQARYAANTQFNVPCDDVFVPSDLEVQNTPECRSVYWNSMQRVLVDPLLLRTRLSSPLFIEMAGIPKVGKQELRGRYMGFIDANVLLEAAQFGVTTSTRLLLYNENGLPTCGPLLELPPTSAKATSARDADPVLRDEYGHCAYIILRFDLVEPLVPKTKLSFLFNTLGLLPGEGPPTPVNSFPPEAPSEDPSLDARQIRKDCGALAVHTELGVLATRGTVRMGQSIKRTAASRLMMRVRMMIRQFPPGDCTTLEWQDTVTSQHAAARRAVTASFQPRPPKPRAPTPFSASRCRLAGDTRLANYYVETFAADTNPRSLLSKALLCLEARNDAEARNYYLRALTIQVKNKYLLWLFGAQEFDKGPEGNETASAALRIAVKGDNSDGISNSISWAAVHTQYHYIGDQYAAFVAAKNMRKAFMLPREWKKFYERWAQTTGEEQVFWIPTVVAVTDPFLISAAFFLCLKCYHFTERLLQCVENGCFNRGSHYNYNSKVSVDVYYIRAASLLLRRRYEPALDMTQKAISRFGPSAILLQMQTSCLACINGWDGDCEVSFLKADHAGAEQCPVLLLRAARGTFHTNPSAALQRAARCHKIAAGGHSALLIGRIYDQIGDRYRAERWGTTAVDLEPMLADGWAFLAILAMKERLTDKARAMIRTANQVGPISPDIKEEIDDLIGKLRMQTMPDALVKDLCFCDLGI
ncbi:uncharacterized protein LOC134665496 [Cydia fagiglandana]|uniref:uncharacterized protein LOC134665496 n=1 Tax=Cydia fagiglandana TaxID=1458189 RepID=UPI002FEE4525